jgi:hypothetical protein
MDLLVQKRNGAQPLRSIGADGEAATRSREPDIPEGTSNVRALSAADDGRCHRSLARERDA